MRIGNPPALPLFAGKGKERDRTPAPTSTTEPQDRLTLSSRVKSVMTYPARKVRDAKYKQFKENVQNGNLYRRYPHYIHNAYLETNSGDAAGTKETIKNLSKGIKDDARLHKNILKLIEDEDTDTLKNALVTYLVGDELNLNKGLHIPHGSFGAVDQAILVKDEAKRDEILSRLIEHPKFNPNMKLSPFVYPNFFDEHHLLGWAAENNKKDLVNQLLEDRDMETKTVHKVEDTLKTSKALLHAEVNPEIMDRLKNWRPRPEYTTAPAELVKRLAAGLPPNLQPAGNTVSDADSKADNVQSKWVKEQVEQAFLTEDNAKVHETLLRLMDHPKFDPNMQSTAIPNCTSNAPHYETPLLEWAVIEKKVDIVKKLLEHKAMKDETVEDVGSRPLVTVSDSKEIRALFNAKREVSNPFAYTH